MKQKNNPSYNYLYAQYRAGARRRKLSFNLNTEQFIEIIKQPCAYCNTTLKNFNLYLKKDGSRAPNHKSTTQRGIDKAWVQISGIDRIRSEQGYEFNNCVPCCSQCNKMKQSYNMIEFIDKIIEIHKHFVQGKEQINE